MKDEDCIGSKKDMKRFASWYRAELLKSLEGKDDGGALTDRERFGLESIEEGHYRVGSENLVTAVEVITTARLPVVRKLLGIDGKKLAGCLDEFAAKSDDGEAIEKLRSSVEWLNDVRETKVLDRTAGA